jgi:hypothetical protein
MYPVYCNLCNICYPVNSPTNYFWP